MEDIINENLVKVFLLTEAGVLSETIFELESSTLRGSHTTKPIPENLICGENEVYIFHGDMGVWGTIKDFRGRVQYLKSDLSMSFVDRLGEIEDEYTLNTPTSENCIWQDGWVEV